MCDEKTLREIFDKFDADKSGSIDKKELKAVLKAYFEAVGEAADEARIEEAAAVSRSCYCGATMYSQADT